MRLITKFALVFSGDEPTAVNLTVQKGKDEIHASFKFPDECMGEEDTPLSIYVQDMCAAQIVDFGGDETAESWFVDWFLVDATLLDNRVQAAPPPLSGEELTGDLSGDNRSEVSEGIELSGDLSGNNGSELGEASEVISVVKSRKKKKREKLRKGSGCKQPDDVMGWLANRLLCVTRNHRTHGDRPWGRCEYRVRCNVDGSYTLEYFAGNRKDVKKGDNWKTASEMFFALMAMPKTDPRGKSTLTKSRHHRMTIKRFFKL